MVTTEPEVRDAVIVLLLALVVVRQLRARPVRLRVPLVLNVIALGYCSVVAVTGVRSAGVDTATIVLLAVSLAVAVAAGGVRARTTTVWREPDGVAWRRGGPVTVAVWLGGFAVQLLIGREADATTRHGGVTAATALLWLCVSLVVQNAVVRAAARRLPAGTRSA